MLEHARAGEAAVFGDVADEDQAGAALLGEAGELRGAFAHLGDRAGRGAVGVGVQRLDGVDDGDARTRGGERAEDGLQTDLGQQLQALGGQLQTLGAQGDLFGGLFAADVNHLVMRREHRQRLEQQRGLANAGVAPDQHHPAGDEAATEHAVEFADAGGDARLFARLDVGQRAQAAGGARECSKAVRPAARLSNGLDDGVPLLAIRTLALPARRAGPAFIADEGAALFCFGGHA